ncbi:BBIP1 protein, partial [Chunga burmeisteri]|nr:BBIP1 protein [Chunga burmeisteri]
MPEGKAAFREVLPKQGTGGGHAAAAGPVRPGPGAHAQLFSSLAGQLSVEDAAAMVLCKPKVLPLKSVSLEKLEKLQRAALEAARPPEGASPPRP